MTLRGTFQILGLSLILVAITLPHLLWYYKAEVMLLLSVVLVSGIFVHDAFY